MEHSSELNSFLSEDNKFNSILEIRREELSYNDNYKYNQLDNKNNIKHINYNIDDSNNKNNNVINYNINTNNYYNNVDLAISSLHSHPYINVTNVLIKPMFFEKVNSFSLLSNNINKLLSEKDVSESYMTIDSTINTKNKNNNIDYLECNIGDNNYKLNKDFINNNNNNNNSCYIVLYQKIIYIEDRFSGNYLTYKPNTQQISESYLFIENIYECTLAPTRVYVAKEKNTGILVAIKETTKLKIRNENLLEFAKNEMVISKYLSKTINSIIQIYDYYESDNTINLVMELCDRPNFFEELLENRYCAIEDERSLKIMAFDVLTALAELHSIGIIHCDIKPQNFLLFNNTGHSDDSFDENIVLKLTDFGLCHYIDPNTNKSLMVLACGTHGYKAPEVKNDALVDCSIDIWSFGISLYKMAVAYFPSDIKKYQYGSGPIPFREKDWNNLSFYEIKDLIQKCLQFESHNRISAQKALKHHWFDNI